MGFLRTLAVLAVCLLATSGSTAERVVLYFNEDNERVALALGKLKAAIAAQGLARRHSVRLDHVRVDYGNVEGIRSSMRKAAAENPSAIIVTTAPLAQIALEEKVTVPVIFGMHQDPVQLGLAKTWRRPGGTMTGLTLHRSDEGKRLELLREMAPSAKRLGVITDEWDRDPANRNPSAAILESLAREQFGFEIHYFRVDRLADLARLVANPKARSVEAWYIPTTKVGFDHPREVARAFSTLRRPTIYSLSMFPENGGVVSYHSVFEDPFASWAKMLALILDGFPAGEIPIERPQAFELAVNVKAAREQGIAIPRSILLRATNFY